MIIKPYELNIDGTNPLDSQIKQKATTLENYQTPRTAKEFYETVLSAFTSQRTFRAPAFLFFRGKSYSLHFSDQSSGICRMVYTPNITRAEYVLDNPERLVSVTTIQAGLIRCLKQDIRLGRVSRFEEMPIEANIDGKTHEICYHGGSISFSGPRLS